MKTFGLFEDALEEFRQSGGAMNYDQHSKTWAVGEYEEIAELSDYSPRVQTVFALYAGEFTDEMVDSELADWVVARPVIDPIDRTVTCVEIDDDDIQDGGISDQLLAELGLVDVTYSKPEFRYDCEMNNGFTLGYYEAGDKTIFRLDLMGNDLELNQVSAEKLEELVIEYERSTK